MLLRINSIHPLLWVLLFFASACQEDGGGSAARATSSGLASVTGPVAVTGSLVLSTDAASEAKDAVNAVQGKTVAIIDETGNKVAEAATDAAGTFQLQLDGSALGLQGESDDKDQGRVLIPKILKLSSLFLMNGQSKDKAVGLQQSFFLDPSRMTKDADGTNVMDTGEQQARKVGAITGQITLETGGDATGIDVFIPGTTYIAKTDKDGRYILGFLPPGTYHLRAQIDGYMTQEWSEVPVGKNETTVLEPVSLPIAIGPQVVSFETESINDVTGQAKIKIKLARATKYRVSRLSDFSDTIFKPVEYGKNEFTVEVSLSAGIKEAKVYLEAADSDGLSANSVLTIDREPPTEGTIALHQSKLVTNSSTVSLVLGATGATKMRFAETVAGLQDANWIDFSSSSAYALQNTSDGVKRIYVSFADNAGNILGPNGEVFVTFTLDRTAPDDGKINLLAPESPTGAFNTPLAWTSDLTESGISYQVQVATSSTFATIIRDMETDKTIINIDPPLSSSGVYHWRVRAIDASGNASSWAESSIANQKFFKVQVLATAFHSNKDVKGIPQQDQYFGKEMVSLGDRNADGKADFAYSIPSSAYGGTNGSCSDCGVVRVVNGANRTIMGQLSDLADRHTAYGHRIVPCDLNNDGRDDIAVTAPGAAVTVNGVAYNNAGAVYVYDGQTLNLMAVRENQIGAGTPAAGWNSWSCSLWNTSNTACLAYGYKYYPYATEYLPWGDGRYYGWSASCVRNSSGPDHLLVGEPKFNDGSVGFIGRVQELTYAAGTLSVTDEINGSNNESSFGAAVQYLSRFSYGNCSTTGPTVAIGAPREVIGGNEKGSVLLYQKSSGVWTYCDRIDAESADPAGSYYGQFLSNLGDIDKDANQLDELAISNSSWQGGVVRIFGGASGTRVKSLSVNTGSYNRIGYKVLPAGDFSDDGNSELLVTAPDSQINGQWGAGAVFLYRWSDLDDDDNNSDGDADGSPYLTITGIPTSGAQLGVSALPLYSTLGDIHSSADSMLLSTPGRSFDGSWGVGSYHEFSSLKLAPSLPTAFYGESTNARMGANISPLGDVDNDSVPDIMLAQPGGRCEGKPWGMVSLFSVLDQKITRSICAESSTDALGTNMLFMSESSTLYFAKKQYNYGYFLNASSILSVRDTSGSTFGDYSKVNISEFPSMITDYDFVGWSDQFYLLTNPNHYYNSKSKAGQLMMRKAGQHYGDWASPPPYSCKLYGDNASGLFGYWATYLADMNSDGLKEILVGEPGVTAGSSKGRIYILDGTVRNDASCSTGFIMNPSNAYVIATLDANASAITSTLGGAAESGLGSFLLGLPDLDGDGAASADTHYFLVSNTNIKIGTSSVTSQYLILAFNYQTRNFSVLKSETGAAGGLLGGYARLLEDINGDGVKELAISYPGGSGRFGATGNVRIFSGLGLSTSGDSSDDLLQALFSPDPSASNFGVSIEYADMSGDGLKDFIIGADLYDSSQYPNAGAVYVFPMRPIQE